MPGSLANVIDLWSTSPQNLKRYGFEIFFMVKKKSIQQHLFVGALERVKCGIYFTFIVLFTMLSHNDTDSWESQEKGFECE